MEVNQGFSPDFALLRFQKEIEKETVKRERKKKVGKCSVWNNLSLKVCKEEISYNFFFIILMAL